MTLKDASGSPVSVSDYGLNFYAQIIKVLDAPDVVNLKVGDSFNAEQNLISAVNPVNNSPIPYSDLTVTSNVNTAVAGTYHVTYTYRLADGKTISITTKVNVSARDASSSNASSTPAKKAKVVKKRHLSPKTSDSTSAASLIVLCASLTALGAVVYKRKRF